MPRRFVSAPLLGLLRQASLTPEQVDAAIGATATRWTYAMLRVGHPLTQTLRQATGVDVVTIARRYHRLLLEVDVRTKGNREWHYQELGLRETVLKRPTAMPHALTAATIGRASPR